MKLLKLLPVVFCLTLLASVAWADVHSDAEDAQGEYNTKIATVNDANSTLSFDESCYASCMQMSASTFVYYEDYFAWKTAIDAYNNSKSFAYTYLSDAMDAASASPRAKPLPREVIRQPPILSSRKLSMTMSWPKAMPLTMVTMPMPGSWTPTTI